MIVPAAICFLAAVPCQSAADQNSVIQLPDQEIVSIQINGFKYYDFDGEARSFEDFEEALGEVRRLEDTGIHRGDTYHAVTVSFADETKETFFFFQGEGADDAWYLEDEDGSLYQNADFIEEYVTLTVLPSEGTIDLSNVSALRRLVGICSQLEALGVSYRADDLRAAFVVEMQEHAEMSDTEDAAFQAARDSLTGMLVQYQYAVSHGYELTEEEFWQKSQEVDSILQSASNYQELEAVFEALDMTYDSYRSYMREYDRIRDTNEQLAQAVYEEFRYGKDEIAGYVCKDSVEYWNYYLMKIVYPEMEDYRKETLSPLLEEAEIFYKEYFSE